MKPVRTAASIIGLAAFILVVVYATVALTRRYVNTIVIVHVEEARAEALATYFNEGTTSELKLAKLRPYSAELRLARQLHVEPIIRPLEDGITFLRIAALYELLGKTNEANTSRETARKMLEAAGVDAKDFVKLLEAHDTVDRSMVLQR